MDFWAKVHLFFMKPAQQNREQQKETTKVGQQKQDQDLLQENSRNIHTNTATPHFTFVHLSTRSNPKPEKLPALLPFIPLKSLYIR